MFEFRALVLYPSETMPPEHTDIIGRRQELLDIAHAFDEAKSGHGGVVLVSGEAGVGITRLCEEAIKRSGFRALTGRAREDAAPSYAPITAALRECLRGGTTEDCGPLAEHLALLLPELGAAPRDKDPAILTEAIAGALSAQSRRLPTALLVDDLQWADNATLELVADLDDRMRNERLLIIATYHSDEISRGHPVRQLRTSLRRARRLREIVVNPFARDDTRALIARVMECDPSDELVDLVQSQTRGFPLYVEELAEALVPMCEMKPGGATLTGGGTVPIPRSIRDTVLLKLERLSEPAHSLAEVAAIAGPEFDFDLVCRLGGGAGQIEHALDELLESGMIRETDSGRGVFRHALTREAVLAEIRWARRRNLHREVAKALEEAGAAPEAIARHWLEAREHRAARGALLKSAERSCRLHAYRDAAAAVASALEIWPDNEDDDARIAALTRLAHCAQIGGQLGEAERALCEIADSRVVSEDAGRRAEVLRALATVHQLQGLEERAAEERREAARAFESVGMEGEAAVEWLALAQRYTATLHLDSALDAVHHAQVCSESALRWDVNARALGLEGNLRAMGGDYDAGKARVHEGLSLALEKNLTEAASEVYRRVASVHEYGSNYAGARDAYVTAIDYCRTQGLDEAEHTCLGCVSYIVLRTGEWKRALEVCREIVDQDDRPGLRAIADGVSGLVRAHRGETRQARKLLNNSLEISQRFGVAAMQLSTLFALALVSEYEDENDAAERYYRKMIEVWKTTDERHDIIGWLCWAATFFSGRGMDREATSCAEILASIASESGNTEALAGLAYALGETSLLQKEAGDAVVQFEQALEHIEKLELPLEHALTQYRLGAALEAAKRRDDAIARMTSAYRIARRLGARPLAARIAATLENLGERVEEGRHPETAARERRGGLTRRQVEITKLIASGLTNKEIAHQLYLSPRTVDMHVSNILDRLDCRSRTEAAQKARDLGILG